MAAIKKDLDLQAKYSNAMRCLNQIACMFGTHDWTELITELEYAYCLVRTVQKVTDGEAVPSGMQHQETALLLMLAKLALGERQQQQPVEMSAIETLPTCHKYDDQLDGPRCGGFHKGSCKGHTDCKYKEYC